uniref:Delta(14)-sterol reductase n=1 Tax=Fagus sylvatica TaxID=28930 RepID=A0A2N9HPH1_FAGSY
MDLGFLLHALIPSWTSVAILAAFFTYLAIVGPILPGKLVPGVILQDGSRLHYRCNGLLSLLLLVVLLGVAAKMDYISPTVISDRGLELLSTTFVFSFIVTSVLYAAGCKSSNQGSSLKPHLTGNLLHDWWLGIQLNPQFMGIDLKFFFVRAGMMGWLLINLSVLARSIQDATLSQSMILYQIFSVLYIMDYFVYEEYMTSTYLVFRGANKQKHVFKKNPKALIWGQPPKVIGGKLLASGFWPISKWRNFLFIASDCDSDLSVNTMINNFNLPSPSPNAVMDIIHDASSLKSSQH